MPKLTPVDASSDITRIRQDQKTVLPSPSVSPCIGILHIIIGFSWFITMLFQKKRPPITLRNLKAIRKVREYCG